MELWEYQQKAANFMIGVKRSYLALDMGMGKSITSIYSGEKLSNKHILLIAEKNEIVNSENFKKEVDTHFKQELQYKSLRVHDLEDVGSEKTVCGINPDGLAKIDLKKVYEMFDTVIMDEATFAKTTTTKRFKTVLKICDNMDSVILLSGTPMMNGAAELYAPLLLLQHPMVYGKGKNGREAFERIFAGGHYRKIRNTGLWYQDYQWWAKGANNVRELRYLIEDQFFFMQKKDTGVFKEKTRRIEYVPMGLKWLAEYTQAWDTYLEEAKKRDVNMDNITELRGLIENGQCYQVNNRWLARRAVQDLKNGKYDGKRVIIFSLFVETDEIVREELENAGIPYETFENVGNFKDGFGQVLAGRIKAHGKGGNVPEACVTLMIGMDYVPANNIQAENRMDRPEQQNPMEVVYYMTEGDDVVDAHVRRINQDKMRKVENFMRALTPEEKEEMPRRLAALRMKFPKETAILGI